MSEVLELPGLRLRPWGSDDARDLLAAFGDPSIRGYAGSVVDTAADAARFVAVRSTAWAERAGVSWAVTSASTGTVLGHVGVHVVNRDLDFGMVGYWPMRWRTAPRARLPSVPASRTRERGATACAISAADGALSICTPGWRRTPQRAEASHQQLVLGELPVER